MVQMMTYEEIKQKFVKYKPNIIMGACFVLVFIIGFGTGRFSQANEKLRTKSQTNYNTNTVKKQYLPTTDREGETTTSTPNTVAKKTNFAPVDSNAPCVVKGNLSTGGKKIYHIQGGASYKIVKPEQCFATEAEARVAGFVKASR